MYYERVVDCRQDKDLVLDVIHLLGFDDFILLESFNCIVLSFVFALSQLDSPKGS